MFERKVKKENILWIVCSLKLIYNQQGKFMFLRFEDTQCIK